MLIQKRWMTSLKRHYVVLVFLVMLSGCSLLDIKIDSQTTPLTQQELKMRLVTREYAQQFFTSVESTADGIAATYPVEDKNSQSTLLLWKINAEEGMGNAIYQVSPLAALLDSWVFTQQMDDFFRNGAGKEQWTSMAPILQMTQTQLDEIAQAAKKLLNSSDYTFSQTFVTQFAAQHRFSDLRFRRTPAYRAWLTQKGVDEASINTTVGTMPEAMSDISDRLSLMSAQTPKVMSWKAQLIGLNSDVSSEDVKETLASVRATSASFQDFVANNPQYMQDLARQMNLELQPLLDDLDKKAEHKLEQLTAERIALETMVERERKAIGVMVGEQRQLLTQDLDALSQQLVTLVMDKLIELIKSTILYFVLFIVTIFFAPLGLGFMLGKRVGQKNAI